ncbi:MAG: hypothetical protein IT208_04235 [Chthonomonadales bacterium]|nr:hypothetical protein [Chthonomonadales bacterium]
MRRRDDIRAAMQSLLASDSAPSVEGERREPGESALAEPEPRGAPAAGTPAVVREIRDVLVAHRVLATTDEVAAALVSALFNRPALCRWLIASQMLPPEG